MTTSTTRYWLIVAARDHVLNGVAQGIAQANHGKPTTLRRMSKDDGVLFYSSKEKFGESEKCQRFTAIGTVADDTIFQVDLGGGFKPFRRRVDFWPCREVDILPLVPELSFIVNKRSWGYVFRFGALEIPKEDFQRIAAQMSPQSFPYEG